MRIPPSHYVELAPTKVGEQVHVNHEECSAGVDRKRRLYIKRTPDCIIAYCHHCNGSGIYHLTSRDVRSVASLKKLVEHEVMKKVTLPKDCEYDPMLWPIEAYAWCAKYGLSAAIIKHHHLSYSISMKRVILPVYNEVGDVIFWQGRAVMKGDSPKYISCSLSNKPQMFLSSPISTKQWVVVEDILSAIKVSDVANVVALLGTSPTTAMTLRMRNEGAEEIFIWLDPDAAGWRGKQECKKKLSLVFDKVGVIQSSLQPKECSSLKIKETLNECRTYPA